MRRNLLIAQTLAKPPIEADVLMISGAHQAGHFSLTDGVDCVTLPALRKLPDATYRPRRMRMSLSALIALRSQIILSSVESFQPDIFIVDNTPRGVRGELDATLAALREQSQTRCVLGLRDIADDPAAVQLEWRRSGNDQTIRDYFDQLWVYGDPAVYDRLREDRVAPDVAKKACFAGYLDQRGRPETGAVHMHTGLSDVKGPVHLCLIGGGEDGCVLANAFARATLPAGSTGVILIGPFLPRSERDALHGIALSRSDLVVIDFAPGAISLVERADRIVAMGGYNTICEILSFGKRALIVPRVVPRREQLIRAERLQSIGLVDMVLPSALDPQVLGDWLRRDLGPPPRVSDVLDLSGLAQVSTWAIELLGLEPSNEEMR